MKRFNVILIVVFILFIFFLFSIPMMFNDDNSFDFDSNKEKVFGKESDLMLKTKFQVIVDDISYFYNNSAVGNYYNPYLKTLLLEDKISNRDNSFAQELIVMHSKNYSSEADILSMSIVESILDKYDRKVDRQFTNHKFYFVYDGSEVVFYETDYLLKSYEESEIKASSTISVSLYDKEIYNFTFENGSKEIIEVDLITGEGSERLLRHTNSSVKINSSTSKYIMSNKSYDFYFKIWK